MPDVTYQVKYRHWMAFRTTDAYQECPLYYASMYGYFEPFLRGQSSNREKTGDYKIELGMDKLMTKLTAELPKPANYSAAIHQATFYLRNWTIFGGLNHISNQDDANNLRHGVRGFRLLYPPVAAAQQRLYYNGMPAAKLEYNLVVQDSDDRLLRVGVRFTGLFAFTGWAQS